MTRTMTTLLLIGTILLSPLLAADPVSFRTAHLEIDAGDHDLAVWQVEITYDKATVAIVGIEGGNKPPFSADAPPYYDPKGMKGGRIVLANFSKNKDLRTGKQVVAQLHLQLSGTDEPDLKITVKAAADKAGKRFDANAKTILQPVAKAGDGAEEGTDKGKEVIRRRMIEVKIRTLLEAGETALRLNPPDYPTALRHLIEAEKVYASSKIDSKEFVAGHTRLRQRIATVHLDYAESLITQGTKEESLESLRKAENLIKTALEYDAYRAPVVEKNLKRIETIKNQLPIEIEVE